MCHQRLGLYSVSGIAEDGKVQVYVNVNVDVNEIFLDNNWDNELIIRDSGKVQAIEVL